jgi:tryptophan 2,3-dioxygenase
VHTIAATVKQLTSWSENPDPRHFPYDELISEYLRVGKHFVAEDILKALAIARDQLESVLGPRTAEADELARFFSTTLDKWDGRYDYPTYTALAMLPLLSVDDPPMSAARAMAQRDRLTVQLAADLLSFELAAADGRIDLLPEARPDGRLLTKRYRLAVTSAKHALARLNLDPGIDSDPALADPEAAARAFVGAVKPHLSEGDRIRMRQSMLPVYISHDEYLFIRVLQLFETTFALLATRLQAAVTAVADGDPSTAAAQLRVSASALRESAPLFSLLATMQVESFRTFRNFTEGASAIQSRNYKIVESLCRKPDADRVDSLAYLSVPEVRERVLAGQATVDDVVTAARAGGLFDPDGEAVLDEAMRLFASALRRWRQTHYRLAVRMLGERTGTGYSEGTPYLNRVRSIPVFKTVTEESPDESEPEPTRELAVAAHGGSYGGAR